MAPLRVLLWHVHGSWTTSFVQGGHHYVVPVTPDRGPWGRGRADTYPWPDNVVEVPPPQLADEDFDVVVLQRPEEAELCRRWSGRDPGRDVPAVYVEHNTPGRGAATSRHPVADRQDLVLVHVTHFNQLMWDSGDAPTRVVEHGVIDPGYQYTGSVAHAGVVVNEPVRRGRAVGTDLLAELSTAAPLDVFGMRVDALHDALGWPERRLRTFPDLPQDELHQQLAMRRVYIHPHRWTSLGLSLIEAMQLGMPVVALATTEAVRAVPSEAGCVSARVDDLAAAVRQFIADPDLAKAAGQAARAAAVRQYGLERFLHTWDDLLREVAKA